MLLKASKNSDDNSDMEVILSGLASLSDEISWFKQEAAKWDVPLSDVVVHKSNQNYCRYHIVFDISSLYLSIQQVW